MFITVRRALLAILFLAGSLTGIAQPGYITTIAGNGTRGYTGDGGPATAAEIGTPYSIAADGIGNVYINDGSFIRKVSVSGIITTFAGRGGATTDGIPATSASLILSSSAGSTGIATDAAGNVYVGDGCRVRKISPAGIITTVGGTTFGYSGDGGPATAAQFNYIMGVCIDGAGNIYVGDENNNRIRKINTAGIVTTIAGTGISGFSGDGGMATAAQLNSPDGICIDATGNVYFADRLNHRIRQIATSGIITTFAGNGSRSVADGMPATASGLDEPCQVCVDKYGDLYIADYNHGRVAVVGQTGIINTFAGGGASFGDGIPATAEIFGVLWGVAIDAAGNIYISDGAQYKIRQVNAVLPTSGLSTTVTKLCNGPQLTSSASPYTAGKYIKTDFGDGTTDSSRLLPSHGTWGYAVIKHTYKAPGAYIINQVLYDSDTPFDTFSTSYSYTFCRSLPVKMFFDADGNCLKDPTEDYLFQPTATEVDSNGVAVDIISATSGFDYSAYCRPGDVYSFKVITAPGDEVVSCPATGVITDTVLASVTTYPDKTFGLSCASKSSFDFGINTVVPVTGIHDQWGYIYVTNAACMAKGGTVTLNFSPKWTLRAGSSWPAETSFTATSLTWTVPPISGKDKPLRIRYELWWNPITGPLAIADTVQSYFTVSPVAGDVDTVNNTEYRNDTIRAGIDPNEMFVSPEGNVLSCAKLKYTINFENTGNDTAHNIYVMDTLSDYVNPDSLRIIMASAEMNITRLKDSGHTIIRFDFPHINLQDSSHHGLCDGSVMFTINARPGLADGTSIQNHAGIFFDYNDVVMTNTVENVTGMQPITGGSSVHPGATIGLADATAGGVWSVSNTHASVLNGKVTGITTGMDTISYTVTTSCAAETQTKVITIESMASIDQKHRADNVELYPNPASGELFIKANSNAYHSCNITNSLGEIIIRQQISGAVTKVDIAKLPAGIYFVALTGDNDVQVQQFVKR